ncbi:hypothetical protein COU37_04915 [Candidatus Micrarchaeota archaeon CG10_big_fil_rev_8_21_14_0_10_45_29]|nr:MAG: hypothetical protein COU37_04915 [Candidatus Micrarchaeota archaeon CG10_big_fil_rev_8_21_14_0_10_45_29]
MAMQIPQIVNTANIINKEQSFISEQKMRNLLQIKKSAFSKIGLHDECKHHIFNKHVIPQIAHNKCADDELEKLFITIASNMAAQKPGFLPSWIVNYLCGETTMLCPNTPKYFEKALSYGTLIKAKGISRDGGKEVIVKGFFENTGQVVSYSAQENKFYFTQIQNGKITINSSKAKYGLEDGMLQKMIKEKENSILHQNLQL